MVRLGRGGEAKGLIVARDLDKKYVRGSEEIHVLLATGVGFALLMGLVGGVPPAIRAARLPVAAALRDL